MSGAGFEPTRVLVVDLDQPVPAIAPEGPDGGRHHRALVLARSGGRPVGLTELDIGTGLDGVEAARLLRSVARDRSGGPITASDRSVSVVVATRDRPSSLDRCLRSLQAVRHEDLQVVVVDNAPSDDRSRRLVESVAAEDDRFDYVREPRPGLAAAHNSGLDRARGELLAFTDDDVVVDRDWVRAIAAAFDVVDDVGCVTGMILPAEIETPSQAWIEAGFGFNKGLDRRIFDLGDHRPDDRLFPYTAGSLGSGANMAFRRDVLDGLGGFDESLGAGTIARGGDDLAAFYDVVAGGHRLVYEPAAIVLHFHHRDPGAVRRTAYSYGVALAAFLTRTLARDPAAAKDFVVRLPEGIRHGLATTRAPEGDEPGGLGGVSWRHRAGLLVGPLAYARSRRNEAA